MTFKKGQSGNPNGRPKGAENVATARVREAIAKFADGNVDKLSGWLERVAEDDPKGAADLFLKAIEYHIPKLQRTESSVELKDQREWVEEFKKIKKEYDAEKEKR